MLSFLITRCHEILNLIESVSEGFPTYSCTNSITWEYLIEMGTSCFSWLRLDLVLSVVWSLGVQLVFFFCLVFSVVLSDTSGIYRYYNTLFPSSANL